MESTVKCKKCGRVLKNPLSIAIGMGPECAGASLQGKSVHIRIRHGSGRAYNPTGAGGTQIPLLSASQPTGKKISKKEMARRRREERRHLFEQRQAFQCGKLSRSKTPLVYEPVGDREWKDNVSGRVMSQEHLQAYLMRYRFI